jgi:glycosyltransferase involved in cell wall biosynthesis
VTGDVNYLALKLPPEKTVLTIHDLSILQYRRGLRRWVLRKLFFGLPARRSKYLTVISKATRDELLKQTDCDSDTVRVIENPLDDRMKGADKRPFNTARPNILQVGTLPYKNVPNLVRAIEGLECTLTLIGEPDEETLRLLKEKNISYRNEKRVEADAMSDEYRKADIVTFCSVFEGFGLPIIEAQAMRTPLVTSNIEPMRSVAGDGALLVDPRDPAEIRHAIDSIIADPRLRENLVERGLENVKRFDPAAVAQCYAELYEEIMQSQI